MPHQYLIERKLIEERQAISDILRAETEEETAKDLQIARATLAPLRDGSRVEDFFKRPDSYLVRGFVRTLVQRGRFNGYELRVDTGASTTTPGRGARIASAQPVTGSAMKSIQGYKIGERRPHPDAVKPPHRLAHPAAATAYLCEDLVLREQLSTRAPLATAYEPPLVGPLRAGVLALTEGKTIENILIDLARNALPEFRLGR